MTNEELRELEYCTHDLKYMEHMLESFTDISKIVNRRIFTDECYAIGRTMKYNYERIVAVFRIAVEDLNYEIEQKEKYIKNSDKKEEKE